MRCSWHHRHGFVAALFLVVGLCELWRAQAVYAAPQGKLEAPAQGSARSGIGVIRGWVCSANQVEVEVEGRGKLAAAYGQPRGDTQAACGDSNNGFSAQVNWNELGDGNYTVQALADGVEFGRAAFTVVTLGRGSFPTGLEGEFMLADFPQTGRRTTVEWQESQQNFVVLAASPFQG